MSSIDDKLNEVLNIADEVIEKQIEKNPIEIMKEAPVPVAPQNTDADTDFETGRNELYKMLEKGNVPKNVTNALFVGSTTELQKLIKKNKDKK